MKISVESISSDPEVAHGFIAATVSFSEFSSGVLCSALVEILFRAKADKTPDEIQSLAIAEARRFLMRVVSSRE